VGKTSLVRRLVEGRFDPNESKTDGIDIQQWHITVSSTRSTTQSAISNQQSAICLNVWDFGGQEIMHATHQFFLTRRSLYVLVLDARLSEDENRVEYWLKMIQSFGGDSPVLVVGNKIDQQPLDLDKRGLRAKYPQIGGIVETSCQTGEGIDKLKTIIARQVGALEHVHDQLLLTWFAVKVRLEQMEQDYIPYTEYVRMCQAEGVTDETSQRTLIGFLHDLGVVLNFQDDPRLEDTNILNPEWVTNGVYKILNCPALQSNGVLERRQLGQILPAQQYPRDKHLFIMDMMRKFELCFDFEGQKDERFLIPDLLAKEEPATGDWSGALAFQYHYNVLPGSVISRFIVRMHPYIHRNIHWRNGVVLGREGNEALVKADREDKQIYIWVRGPEKTRRELLSIIRAEFGAIHSSIPGLEVAEKVPLPDHPEVVVDYNHLRKLERKGVASFIPEGPVEEPVSVRQLLDGVGEPQQDLRVGLRELLKSFSDNELRDMCFELCVDYEELPGEGKSGKARELISYLDRRGRLAELVAVGKRLRPDVGWGEW
jgi:internalin A